MPCKSLLFVVLALATLLNPAKARGEAPEEKALALIQAGKNLYKDGKFELALERQGTERQGTVYRSIPS